MVEKSFVQRAFPHLILLVSIFIIVFPIWIVFAGSTQTLPDILDAPMSAGLPRCVPPSLILSGAGMLTGYPSPTPFGLG